MTSLLRTVICNRSSSVTEVISIYLLHLSLCRQVSLQSRLIMGAVLTLFSVSAACITAKQIPPAPKIAFFISSIICSQLTPPSLWADLFPLLTYPFWQFCSPPHVLQSITQLSFHTLQLRYSPHESIKSSWVWPRLNICHIQKPTNSDQIYRKRHAKSTPGSEQTLARSTTWM